MRKRKETAAQALRRVAKELEGCQPVAESFKSVRRDAVAGANIAIRMAVELLRERAAEAQK